MDTRTRRLAYLGLLIALAVVLTRVASVRVAIGGVEGIRLGFGAFPLILAGVLYGPVAGALVGALSDILGFFISPMGPYMPHFTLTAALTGALPALLLAVPRSGTLGPPSLSRLVVALSLGQLVSSALLVTYFLQTLFGLPWEATLLPRVISLALTVPAYAVLLHMLIRRVPGLVPLWERVGAGH